MAVKKTLFSCLVFITNLTCYSQNLYIHIKAELSNEYIYLRKNKSRDKINIPYLLIQYKNSNDHDIYVKKIVEDNEVMSFSGKEDMFLMLHAIEALKRGQESISTDTYTSDTEFFVDISNPRQEFFLKDSGSLYSIGLFQIQTTNWKLVDPLFFDDIGLLKEVLDAQQALSKIDSTKQLIFFDYPHKKVIPFVKVTKNVKGKTTDMTYDNSGCTFPLEQFKNQFVFLKKNEEYIQRVNILPFFIIGGTYDLSLAKHKFENYLRILNDKSLDFTEFKLPDTFDNYKLYTGEFKTDSAHIIFDNKKGFTILGNEK